ncbi:MAG: hypothetical protein R2703_05195 [Micropruina glycogenica]|nr:hypothetical protein [Propionibacteriaceae bacterium]
MADQTVDDYIAGFEAPVRERLLRVRELLLAAMPQGEQKMRYGIAAIMVDGRYGLHFAGWKKHIGLYPVPVFDDDLEAEVKPLRRSKDSVALVHAEPLPEQLISRIAHAVVERRAS